MVVLGLVVVGMDNGCAGLGWRKVMGDIKTAPIYYNIHTYVEDCRNTLIRDMEKLECGKHDWE